MKRMTDLDVDSAVKNIANYYRSSRLYTSLLNTDDAYLPYIKEYTEDTRLIVQQGHSYKLKDEYLIALNLKQFEQEHNEAFHHYFDCIYKWMESSITREKTDVIFICAAGPSQQFFTSTTYKLLKEFVAEYTKKYAIFTDCPVEIDFAEFGRISGSSLVLCAGMEYYRWACRR